MSGYTTTPNYALLKPTPNADDDQWGSHLNANADTLDNVVKTISDKANTVPAPSATLPGMDGTATPGAATAYARGDHVHPTDTSRAPIASPTFTGDPRAPTATPGDADTSIATTAFVAAAISAMPAGASVTVSDTPPASPSPGALWYDSTNTGLYLRYNDGNSAQWVVANNQNALPDAPTSGALYGRQSGAWAQAAPAAALNATGRNLLHNGLFNVAQRGVGPWTTGVYTVDRWIVGGLTDAFSFSNPGLADGDRTGIGDEAAAFAFANTFTGNAAAGAYHEAQQRIEGVRRLAGKTVTLSFWAIASGTQKLGINATQSFGTGGSPSANVSALTTGIAVTLSVTWTRYSVSIPLPSAAGKTLGTANNDYTMIRIAYSSGATNNAFFGNIGVQSGTINLWGVQLEIGSVATPLEKLDPRIDLSNCQRFYCTGARYQNGYGGASNTNSTTVQWPVTMRAAPTVVSTPISVSNCANPSVSGPSVNCMEYYTAVTAAGNFICHGSYTASADL